MHSALPSPAVGLIALVAGCGGGSASTLRPSVPLAGVVADSGIPTSNPPVVVRSPVPLSTVTPAPDADHELQSVLWTLTGRGDGGRTLVISYTAGGGNPDAGIHVTQTSSYVMVAAYNLVSKPSRTPMTCPLGGRPLYHAPLG